MDRTALTRLRTLACAALLACAAAAQAAPPPIADFVRRDEFFNPVLSPDGRHIALNRRVQIDGRDVTVIGVYHLPDMKSVSTVRLPVFEVPLSHRWITNTRLAVSTGTERGSIDQPSFTGEIMAMDIDGGRQEYLYGYRSGNRRFRFVEGDEGWATILRVPANRNGHVFLTENLWGSNVERSRVLDVDSVSGARRMVTEIDKRGFNFLLDRDDQPRFAGGGDAAYMLSVWQFDAAKAQWTELAGRDKANLQPLAFDADGKSFLALASQGGGPRLLVRQAVDDGARSVIARELAASIESFEWTPPPLVPFAAWTELDLPRVHYLDETRVEAQLHKLLSGQFAGSRLRFLNFTDDGAKLLFEVSSDRNPGDYYLLDRASSQADLLFSASSWLDPEKMARREPVRFKASDGLELHGYLTLPPVQGDAKPPLVLLPHGGPHGVEDAWAFDGDAQFLASRGYAVLQVNFRGSSGRGPRFEGSGYRQWGLRIQDDLIDGVRWVQAQGRVDPQRACIVGASFGGYSAMMAPTRAPGLFQCAVGYSGLYDIGLSMERDELKTSPRSRAALLRYLGTDPAQWAAQSPTRHASEITLPVLLVHGGEDKRTPPDQATTMRDALARAGHPPEFLMVAGEGHGFYAEKNRALYYDRLEAFLARHLKP